MILELHISQRNQPKRNASTSIHQRSELVCATIGTNADTDVAGIVALAECLGCGLEWELFIDQIGKRESVMVIRKKLNRIQQILGNLVMHAAYRQVAVDDLLWCNR